MKTAVIIVDHAGYPRRVANTRTALARAGVDVHAVCPHYKPHPHAQPVEIPEDWLPEDPAIERWRKDWHRCHLHYVAGYAALGLDADFLWCIENDVATSGATWLRLLEETNDLGHDGLFARLSHRAERPGIGWFSHPGTARWMNWYHHGCIYRLSRRALSWLSESAGETREAFCEVAVASVIDRAGGTLRGINTNARVERVARPRTFYNCQTLCFPPRLPVFDPRFFNHPCKADDPAPGS